MIRLFVDDIRIPPEGWHLARTITEAIRILSQGFVDVISLDHDILDPKGHYGLALENYSTVARYVAIMPDNLRPSRVYIHTANFHGAAEMTQLLEDKVQVIRINEGATSETYVEELTRLEK